MQGLDVIRGGCGNAGDGCANVRDGCGYAGAGCVDVRDGCGYAGGGCANVRDGCAIKGGSIQRLYNSIKWLSAFVDGVKCHLKGSCRSN